MRHPGLLGGMPPRISLSHYSGYACCDIYGDDMSNGEAGDYLPGDPRYGLSGEALKNYYRTKPAQWAIYCWDKPGTADARRALLAEQKAYVKNFGERVIGYGHFVSDDGRDTLGTSFFMQLDDRAAADQFIAGEPMNKAGVYSARRNPPLVEQLRQARGRLSPQGTAAVPVHGAEDRQQRVLPQAPARPRSRTSRRMATASSSAGRSARPTAPTTSAPRCCWNCRTARRPTSSGTRSRSPRTAATTGTRGSSGGCSGIDEEITGHPPCGTERKAWMPATSVGMTWTG